MPRKVAKASRSTDAGGTGAVTVVAGSIRTADDPTALDVKLSIWDTEITMRADGSELGHWPANSVTIKALDAFSFEFVAEGDRLIFLPNNPDEFKDLPIVVGPGASRRRKKKSKEKKVAPQPAELRWDETTEAETNLRKKKVKEPKPTRQERKAATRKAKDAVAGAKEARKVKVPVGDYDTQPRSTSRPAAEVRTEAVDSHSAEVVAKPTASPKTQPEKSKRERPARAQRSSEVKTASNGESKFGELRHKAWLSSLDLARRYDLFGLDRVPVNESLRDQADHPHTWEHRVAPASGPGSFLCTICGAIRRKD